MTDDLDTKKRILDTAEQLFAEQGFAKTPLRKLTQMAGVNQAAVNYHFGSKDKLIEAVFARRLSVLNQQRLQRLAAVKAQGATLEGVLRAFIAPTLELSADHSAGGARFAKLLGRSYTETSGTLRQFIHSLYAEVLETFKAAVCEVLPHIPKVELYWRLHFVLGALSYTMAGTEMMRLMIDCRVCDPSDTEAVIQRLIPFLIGGLQAPLPTELLHSQPTTMELA